MSFIVTRGRLYIADIGYGEKPWLCVSNNSRNQQLGTWLGIRVTTTRKPVMASIVPMTRHDPLVGSILCDNIVEIEHDEIRRESGAVSLPTLMAVSAGLKAALAL